MWVGAVQRAPTGPIPSPLSLHFPLRAAGTWLWPASPQHWSVPEVTLSFLPLGGRACHLASPWRRSACSVSAAAEHQHPGVLVMVGHSGLGFPAPRGLHRGGLSLGPCKHEALGQIERVLLEGGRESARPGWSSGSCFLLSRAERPRQHHEPEQRLLPGDGELPRSSRELHLRGRGADASRSTGPGSMVRRWAAEQEGQVLSTVEKMPLTSLTVRVCSLQHGFSTVGGGIWLSEALPQLVLSSSAPRIGDHPMLVTMLGFCRGVPQV